MILTNGKVATMDADNSFVESVAIESGKIVKIGSNEDVLSLKDETTEVVDLKGKLLLPGFNDSHMHLLNYGYSLQNVDLIGTESIEEIIDRMKNIIEKRKPKEKHWVTGRGWNHDYFRAEHVFPTRYDLDKITTEYPVAITRTCGHVMIVNSKALEAAGITKETEQVNGGEFDLDENGEPLGIFREKALELINRCIPEPTVDEIKKILIQAMDKANACGITSIQSDDFEAIPGKNYENIIKAYEELRDEKNMSLRIYEQCLLPEMSRLTEFLDKEYNTGYGDEVFKIGPLKLLVDGSLGARTALLTNPYEDDKSTSGISVFTQEELDALVEKAHMNNMQVAIHGIGDKSICMALEAIEKALNKNQKKDHRHGIVHCQITDEYLMKKLEELDVLAYIQPIFLDYDWHIAEDRIGPELMKTSYNWKTFVDKDIPIACGSDCPVESFDVLNGIYTAVTRKDLKEEPEGGWIPEQRLTVEEAVYGFTMGGAYSSFENEIKGSIEEGKLADMVVLAENIFEIPEEEIKDVDVEMTIFNGEIVYKK